MKLFPFLQKKLNKDLDHRPERMTPEAHSSPFSMVMEVTTGITFR